MEAQATAEMADVGVTPGAEASTGAEDTSPVSESNDDAVVDQTQEAEESEQAEEVLPFGKHPRWQKMLSENRAFKSELQQIKSQMEGLSGAVSLDKWLRANPQALDAVIGLMRGNPQAPQQEKQTINYDAYEPEVADQFRKIEKLSQTIERYEQERQAEQARRIETIQYEINTEFDQLLNRDGYLSAEGSPVDESLVNMITSGTLAALREVSQNPDAPTKAELRAAYKAVKDSMDYLKQYISRETLKQAVKPSVPLSGSRKGAPPAGKTSMTEEERIREMASML